MGLWEHSESSGRLANVGRQGGGNELSNRKSPEASSAAGLSDHEKN